MPTAKITLLSNADPVNPTYVSAANVLPRRGLVDEWLTYPSGGKTTKTMSALIRLATQMRRKHYDVLFYLMPRTRTPRQVTRDLLFFKFAGIKTTIGARYLKKNHLTVYPPRPLRRVESEAEFLWQGLSYDNFPGDLLPRRTDLSITQEEARTADEWLLQNVPVGRALIGLAPGSKWPSKVWDAERYSTVLRRLIARHGLFPVIFGGPEDSPVAKRIIERVGIGASCTGKLSVREAAAALSRCSLYLGNDTGTMHLAASAGVPCVAIFAAVDWMGRWNPFGKFNTVIRKSVECEGCHTPDCFNANKCLELISVEEVFSACSDILLEKTANRFAQNR